MNSIIDRIRNEPALLSGFVVAALSLLAAFGLELTGEQTAAISAVVGAALAVLVRSQVTPTRKLGEADPEGGHTDALGVALIALVVVVILVLLGVLR